MEHFLLLRMPYLVYKYMCRTFICGEYMEDFTDSTGYGCLGDLKKKNRVKLTHQPWMRQILKWSSVKIKWLRFEDEERELDT